MIEKATDTQVYSRAAKFVYLVRIIMWTTVRQCLGPPQLCGTETFPSLAVLESSPWLAVGTPR